MTNDGALAYRLTHSRFEHAKEYRVTLVRPPTQSDLDPWQRGPVMEELGGLKTAKVILETGAWLRVILTEGKKRQIRRTAEHLGYSVERLIRVGIGPQELGNLGPAKWGRLSGVEVARLKQSVGLTDDSFQEVGA